MAVRIGIIGAMESEVCHLRDQLENKQVETIAGTDYYAGTLCGRDVVLAQCGIGKVNAAVCAQTLIVYFGVSHIVNTGVAGSLDARINIGDIVVSSDAVQHDFDTTPLGYAAGQVPGLDVLAFSADAELRALTVAAVGKAAPEVGVFEGRVASGDQFVAASELKDRIVGEFGALCSEMEGAAIAQTCHLAKVPFVIVRAISDKADGSSSVDYRTFEVEAANRSARIVAELVQAM